VGEPVESAPFRQASIRLTISQFGNKGMWKKQIGSSQTARVRNGAEAEPAPRSSNTLNRSQEELQ
jgi:hypothetical protein